MAIDSYLASVARELNVDDHDDVEALKRALELSTRLRDGDRTAAAKDAMLARFHIEVDKDGWWLHLFEALIGNRRCGLSADERDAIVAKLEALLEIYTAEATFDPPGAERVANYIIPIYSAAKEFDAVKRVALAVSEAYEKLAKSGSSMQAIGWLQTAADFARRADERERYKKLKVDREAAIRASATEMKSFSFSQEIKTSEIDEVLDLVINKASWQQTLFNIASRFIVTKQELRYRSEEGARKYPLSSLFTTSVIAGDHVAAQVGGDDDKEGPLYRYTDFSRQGERPFFF